MVRFSGKCGLRVHWLDASKALFFRAFRSEGNNLPQFRAFRATPFGNQVLGAVGRGGSSLPEYFLRLM